MYTENMIIVPREAFEMLSNQVAELRMIVHNQSTDNTFRHRVLALASKGCINGGAVCKLMGWSPTTLWRRVNDGTLPMTKDGNRWKMTVEEFINWHATYFLIDKQ